MAKTLIENILDCVWEAYAVLDRKGLCTSYYSKQAEAMLGAAPLGQHFLDILRVGAEERSTFLEWYEFLFTFNAPFEEIAALGPKHFRSLSPQQHVTLRFQPVYSEDKVLQAVVMIADDNTEEHEAIERADKLRSESEMVVQRYRHAAAFERSLELIHECSHHLQTSTAPLSEIQLETLRRELHTLKGVLGIFSMTEIAAVTQRLERDLLENGASATTQFLQSLGERLEQAFQTFFETYHEMLGLDKNRGEGRRIIPLSKIRQFQRFLVEAGTPIGTLHLYYELFGKVQLLELLRPLKMFALKQAMRLNKNVRVELDCADELAVDPAAVETFINHLTHAIDYSISYGIEERRERLALQKPDEGCLQIKAKIAAADLLISVCDDGCGLDILSLHEQQRVASGEENVFARGFSSRRLSAGKGDANLGLEGLFNWVEHNKGSVQVQSTPGVGCVFEFRVPLNSDFKLRKFF